MIYSKFTKYKTIIKHNSPFFVFKRKQNTSYRGLQNMVVMNKISNK